ncbi:MAG: alanine racemase [Firmicutes bacterium]|nr:alanine racemase [Bacillota bacterium]
MNTDYIRRTWLEVDLDAIEHNYRTLKEFNGGAEMLGVVKADAYGCGAAAIAGKLEKLGARYLAVAELEEALQLRDAGIKAPILILGYTPPEYTDLLIKNDVTAALPTLEDARCYSAAAVEAGKPLRVHLKLDTGMGRLGFRVSGAYREKSLAEIKEAAALPGLVWEGVFMHFAVSDTEGADNEEYTRNQFRLFTDAVSRIEAENGIKFALKHCSNSGASCAYPEYALDMIRPGISLYGLESFNPKLQLRQCIRFKSALGPIKEYEEGSSVSYGRTFTNRRTARIAILPAGYADGLRRELSGQFSVMTPYGPAPVVGRICMDMCMVDVTDLPGAKTGDEVELYGDLNTWHDVAEKLGTISYTLSCGISDRVPRVYTENGKVTGVRKMRK